ncbi:MAG TPA: M81 family metallopeptidase [Thermomicrobiales bacterium]|nr:M81 family metallopeptidase [Thermomicrobiales bacterium]
MKILIAECRQEVSSFNPVNSGIGDFTIRRGSEMLDSHRGRRTEVGGALEIFDAAGIEVVGTYSAQLITSGGILDGSVWDQMSGELIALVRENFAGVDGIFMALHGAMATTNELDPEGFLIQEVRNIAGPDTPIVASLDLHGILTDRMLENANGFAVYHTYPHEDFDSTGRRAARLLIKLLREDVHPVTAVVRIPALVRGDELITASGKIGKSVSRCVQLEESGEALSAAMIWSNPFTDVPELCSLALITTDGDPDFAAHEALSLASTFWDDRAAMQAELVPVDQAIDRATGVPGTTVLVDAADATSSGASGDSNAIFRAVIEQNYPGRGLFPVVDAPAVRAAMEAGIGATISAMLGGSLDPARFTPLPVEARVKMLSDGKIRYESHGFGPADAGPTAVLEVGRHIVVVTSRPVSHFDRALFLDHGQNPNDFDLVVQKSPHCPHYCFRDWAAQLIGVDAPGSTSANLPSLGHTICRRPMYPMELDTVFEPEVQFFSR